MPPLLIDHRRLTKITMLIMLIMLGVFVAGYYLGYHRAEVKISEENQLVTEPSLSAIKSQQTPEKKPENTRPKTTEHRTVKQKSVKKKPVKSAAVSPVVSKAAVPVKSPVAPVKSTIAKVQETRAKVKETRKEPVDDTPEQKKAPIKEPVVTSVLKTKSSEFDNKQAETRVAEPDVAEQVNDEPEITVLEDTTNPAEEIRKSAIPDAPVENTETVDEQNAWYSIQVGVYSSLENAVHMVNQLEQSKFAGYLLDYINEEQETRYNVRFGYYTNRSTALAALEKYNLQMSGSGYIVHLDQ